MDQTARPGLMPGAGRPARWWRLGSSRPDCGSPSLRRAPTTAATALAAGLRGLSRRRLREHGIEVHADLPAVGANLHDHPAAQLEFAGTRQLRDELGLFATTHWLPAEQALAKIASPMADGPFDLHAYPWVEPDEAQPAGWKCVVPAGLLTPKSRGRLRLRSAGPGQRAEAEHARRRGPRLRPVGEPELKTRSGQLRIDRDRYAGAGARATSTSRARTGRPSQ